eukprot:31264-Pelagococcus_subviridis.AAC.4
MTARRRRATQSAEREEMRDALVQEPNLRFVERRLRREPQSGVGFDLHADLRAGDLLEVRRRVAVQLLEPHHGDARRARGVMSHSSAVDSR